METMTTREVYRRGAPGSAPSRAELEEMARAHEEAVEEVDGFLAEVDEALSPEGTSGRDA